MKSLNRLTLDTRAKAEEMKRIFSTVSNMLPPNVANPITTDIDDVIRESSNVSHYEGEARKRIRLDLQFLKAQQSQVEEDISKFSKQLQTKIVGVILNLVRNRLRIALGKARGKLKGDKAAKSAAVAELRKCMALCNEIATIIHEEYLGLEGTIKHAEVAAKLQEKVDLMLEDDLHYFGLKGESQE